MIKRIVLFFVIAASFSFSENHFVGKNSKYNSIKEALAICKDKDTITVLSGYFSEKNIVIEKSISLLGKDFPTLDGQNKFEIITIKKSGVTISGFRLINAGISYTTENAAIKIDNADSCRISNNILQNNFFGIYLGSSKHCLIDNNTISASGTREVNSGNGIHLWKSRHITISGNKINGHRDGIYLEFVDSSLIKKNYCFGNIRYGLHFMFSNNCTYFENTFAKNNAGVAVMFTRKIKMTKNIFEHNWGTSSYGLLLKEIYDSHIHDNIFRNNSIGLYSEGSNKILIEKNIFTRNGWAIRLMANSMDNTFARNDFVSNTFDISTNSIQNFNYFTANYWSGYKGYDLNRDGDGDIPHRPVTLFSVLIEKNPSALLLLRSFLIDFLNLAENVLPVLTPETLTDNNPRMVANN